MKFNASKCNVMRISRKRNPGEISYKMMGEQLKEVTSHQYLGVHIENNLKWNRQTKHASEKATKVLNYIRRNFHFCSKSVKEKLYQTLVRPHLEYASIVWNPVSKENKNLIKMVQRRAARFVLVTTIGNQVLAKCTKTLDGTPWNSGGKNSMPFIRRLIDYDGHTTSSTRATQSSSQQASFQRHFSHQQFPIGINYPSH